jgi:hypothetical protein
MPEIETPKKTKKRAILIEIPQEYADRLSKQANKDHRSTKAHTEWIVMRALDATPFNKQTARAAA